MSKFTSYHQRFKDPEERFWEKVDKTDDCWWWVGTILRSGYGQIHWKGKKQRAHRIAYLLHNGHLPKSSLILHKCDNPSCVNPEHLYAGSNKDNSQDMVDRGRHNPVRGEDHPNAKLTVHQVMAIKLSDKTCKELSEKYGVCPMTISRIKRAKRWRNI